MKLWTELEGAEFAVSVRGYDRDEVNDFVDAAVAAVREVEDQRSALYAKVKALESELAIRRQSSSSIEQAFLEAVKKKQAMLADAEKRADEILARAESHAANSAAADDVEALRNQARLMLEQASTMLADAQREAALIRSSAVADGESGVAQIKAEAERMLAAAEAEAAAIVAGAEQQHDRLAAALRLLQDAVGEMLQTGAERHEAIRVVLDENGNDRAAADRGAAIAEKTAIA
jgi:DivIVA domain-containing protein